VSFGVSSTTPELHVAWEQVRARLRGLIGRRVSDPEAVEDLVQDVLLRVSAAASGGEQFQSLSAWLDRVAHNAVIDHYRTRRRLSPIEEAAELADPSAWPYPAESDDRHSARELAKCLRPLMEQLPPPSREALVLTDIDGLTQAAAATALGLSISGMKSRVQRARLQLRALLVACCPVDLDVRGAIVDHTPPTQSCGCAVSTPHPDAVMQAPPPIER
jgi:RNA polymerase sigma-70 factor, ECF subfamily